MASIPPVIPPVATEPGLHTPSHQWASDTTDALKHPDSNAQSTSVPNAAAVSTTEDSPIDPGLPYHSSLAAQPSSSPTAPDVVRTSSSDGPQLPGAFHADTADTQTQQTGMETLKGRMSDAATSMGETAKQYLPKGVVETVQGYLPHPPPQSTPTFPHDNPHTISMPSSELAGATAGEHVGGVGALPGHASEISVAKLPDERNQVVNGGNAKSKDISLPSSEPNGVKPQTSSGGVGALPGKADEEGVARLPDEHVDAEKAKQAGDSHAAGTGAAVAGASAVGLGLVGAGVATGTKGDGGKDVGLPGGMDDRAGAGDQKLASSQGQSQDTAGSKATGGVGTNGAATGSVLAAGGFGGREVATEEKTPPVNTTSSSGPAAVASENKEQGTKVEEAGKQERGSAIEKETQITSSAGTAGAQHGGDAGKKDSGSEKTGGYDTDYHPAQLHPITSGSGSGSGSQSQSQQLSSDTAKKEGVSEKANETSSRSSKDSGTGSGTGTPGKEAKKKVGFMEKMKGEAKMLLGKVEGGKKGEELVEEGKRIKSGLGKGLPPTTGEPAK